MGMPPGPQTWLQQAYLWSCRRLPSPVFSHSLASVIHIQRRIYCYWRDQSQSRSMHEHWWVHFTETEQLYCKCGSAPESVMLGFGILKVKTSHTDTLGGQTAVRSTGRARLFTQRGVFKQDSTVKMFGTGQNRSFRWGVRPSRVFVRRGSTVLVFGPRCQYIYTCISYKVPKLDISYL